MRNEADGAALRMPASLALPAAQASVTWSSCVQSTVLPCRVLCSACSQRQPSRTRMLES
ncbi:hypothetical protein D9M69_659730 [compost metagenome]